MRVVHAVTRTRFEERLAIHALALLACVTLLRASYDCKLASVPLRRPVDPIAHWFHAPNHLLHRQIAREPP